MRGATRFYWAFRIALILMACVYVAPQDRIAELKSELRNVVFERDNFFIAEGALQEVFWAQNVWINVERVKIESIKGAANFLKAKQRKWYHFPLSNIRRTKLIQENLPKLQRKPLEFPAGPLKNNLGSFALLNENEMIYSPDCTSPVPNGEFLFKEPSYESPGQAYLKLWEAITRLGSLPRVGDYCVDLGSSPGSWTQALLKVGAKVLSVDKAELEIAPSSRLNFMKKDAFKLDPADLESPLWIFSDIICYPDKLLELAKKWKEVHPHATFVFTIKFQGKWDREIVKRFAQIPHSQVLHLYNNKHELCWISKTDI